jgi:type II secretory pathway predicted ATPase ExeA
MGEFPSTVSPAKVFARPTADEIWLGPAQTAGLSQLSRRAALRLLVGPPSSGKSTLLHRYAATAGAACVVLECRGPKADATSLLASLLLAADLAPWELSEVEQRNLLTVFVQQRRSQGRRVVIAVDDAQAIEAPAWRELERLAAFKIDRQPAVELLLCGSATLAQQIDSAAFGVADAALVTHVVPAPSTQEISDYILWRLGRFGMSDAITPVARQMIARLSGGRFGAADVLCQMALLLLRQLGIERVDARVARQAVATLASRQAAKLERTTGADARPRPAAAPQGHLLVSRDGKIVTRAALGSRTLLGRSEHNDLCLPSPYLSRHHAVIVGTPDGYYVVDLSSANGIALNGRRIARAILCDQDVLGLGPYRIKVQIPEWLPHGNPWPKPESLTETAVLPRPDEPLGAAQMRRIK